MSSGFKQTGWFDSGSGSFKRAFKGADKKFYKRIKDKYVRLPKNTKILSNEAYKSSQEARGRQVTTRDSAGYAQIIYGRMRLGGAYSYLDTSQESKAYLVTGTGNASLLFVAKATGATGNNITVNIVCSGTNGTLTVGVVGNAITITVRSTSSVSNSTRTEVIAAVEASVPASALVEVKRTGADGNGNILAFGTANLGYGGGNWLHHYISLAFHECDALESVWIDNRLVTFGASPDPRWATGIFANRFFATFVGGTDTQETQADMATQVGSAKWSADHRQRGVAGVYAITVFDINTYADGFPELEFLVRGKKCYDPRTATTVWTQNAALIIGDYLMNTRFGMSVPLAKIDSTAWIDAANCCDENVTLAIGGTEKRYTVNGVFDTGMTHQQVLSEMLLAMAGDLVYQGGKWFIYAGKWRAPSFTITEDDFRGPIKISVNVSKRDNYNGVKGTIIDPTQNYDEIEYPLVKNSLYITSDGLENFMDLKLNLVHSSAAAQRIAKLMLDKNRQSIEFAAPMSIKLLAAKVGNVVNVNFTKYGWINKTFEIRDFNIRYDPIDGVGCDVVFRETAASLYTDAMAEFNYDPAPNTALPNAYTVIAPTALVLSSGTSELYIRQDGTVFSRLKVSWTAPNDLFVTQGGKFEVQYKKSADVSWTSLSLLPSTQTSTHILDVQDEVLYDVRVRAVNTIGINSSWLTSASSHLVLGKSEKPSNVAGFTAAINNFSVALSWSANTELDIAGYRIKRSTSTDWFAATLVDNLVRGNNFENNFRQAGTWNYLIRAVDTSENESTSSSSVTVVIAKPLEVASFSVRVTNNIILLDWEEPSSTTFPIAKYKIYKGNTFETSTLLGEAFVTFQAWTEQFSGSSYFYITAVDTGGNESSPVGKFVNWFAPPDIVQYVYGDFDADNTELSSAVLAEGYTNAFIAPVVVEDNWIQHFTRNGWADIAAQVIGSPTPFIAASVNGWIDEFTARGWATNEAKVNAGFEVWIEPADTDNGYFIRTVDAGSVIQGARVEASYTETLIDGSVVVECYISTSKDLIAWTDHAEGTQVLANDFRFVKLQIVVNGADEMSLVRIGNPTITIGVREYTLSGRSTTKADGTLNVLIGSSFMSVSNIQLTPIGGVGREVYPIFNYATLNPTSFDVTSFVSGSPAALDFNWTVIGSTGEL